LIQSARAKKAIDLSVVLSPDLPLTWTGKGIGNHRHPYVKANFLFAPNIATYHHTHLLDSQTGTHLVPPSFSLPAPGFDEARYSTEVRTWLKEYEQQFGKRGTSEVTTEQVPI